MSEYMRRTFITPSLPPFLPPSLPPFTSTCGGLSVGKNCGVHAFKGGADLREGDEGREGGN